MTESAAETPEKTISSFPFWLLSFVLLLPWVYVQHQTSINSDVAWLSICADRFLNGGSMLRDCYDTNPPLSILIYTPFAWLSDVLSVPIYHCVFWLTFVFIILGVYVTQKVLRSFPILSDLEKNILLLTYLCSITIIPTLYYAERDHFLAIMLLPFILVQIGLTCGYKTPKFTTFLVLNLGSIALLLKPHFGLIPVFLFLHRMVIQRRFWVIKDQDFLVLLSLSIGYLAIVFIYFNDFITIILPDIIQTYLNYNAPQKVYITAMPYAALVAMCFTCIAFIKDKSKALLLAIAGCALLSLVVYCLQMKGFTYHRLPLYALLFPLLGILSLKIAQLFTKQKQILLFGLAIVIFVSSYAHAPLRPDYPTHADYQNNEITEYIDEHCEQPCSFYITYENMDIVSQLALYSEHTYATRFPSFWFLSTFQNEPPNDTQKRFADYVAKDIERFSPSLIFVMVESPAVGVLDENKTLAGYFTFSPEFEKVMSTYEKTDRLTVDRAYFYKGTPYDFPYLITWDIYTKVSEE